MNIVFRADASQRIGTGHVMRCLTLADALASMGHSCLFLTRSHPGHLAEVIRQRRHKVLLMSPPKSFSDDAQDKRGYGQWLGSNWQADAEETITLLNGIKPDWLVVDHYAIDEGWHKALQTFVEKVMVIDDLADRVLVCDVVLNQNYGCNEFKYRDLIKSDCRLLLGVDYALLRPKYVALRAQALEKRHTYRGIRRILVSMGGTDPDNVTALVLDGLARVDWQERPTIDVVLNSRAPHLQAVFEQAQRHTLTVSVSVNVNDMAERMLRADLAIGAGGSTTWERCCMGLPSLLIITAENQRSTIAMLHQHGVVFDSGYFSDLSADDVKSGIQRVMAEDNWRSLSDNSFALVDGQGCLRVAGVLNSD